MDFARGLADLALPPRCAACNAPPAAGGALCDRCRSRLTWLAPSPPSATEGPLSALVAAVSFKGDALTWIHRFKYPAPGLAGLDPAAGAVALELARGATARAGGPAPDCVVPIPLHRKRLAARGFNPAAYLAKEIAHVADVRFAPTLLVRTRNTPSQTGRGRLARVGNVAGAFTCRAPARVPERIWLVDDVVTTGSTLREAARVLRRAGAREILGLCAARTELLR